ncbi:hypothetical protein PIB30_079644 [Stylosanthes scabra]|uniref:Aminotransferase-like plant mobile domain-containing protein n=1 Tax=Stylosanthes scabra TaxID=79078 RepID=A0ABU6ZPW4_9FABA|nr:hypothetical protein [Stylosanthes scabra]
MSLVRDAGFKGPLMMRDFDIDGPLLLTFVERWRHETYTLHLPFGEYLLGARPSLRGGGKDEYAAIKLMWLRKHTSQTIWYLSWLPLLEDFEQCKKLFWRLVVLCYTYHCLCRASDRATTDIAECLPLMMSWIHQRFPRWCADECYCVPARLESRDTHETRMVTTRLVLDRLGVNEVPNNLDGFLDVSARGEDQWWPMKHVDWYNDWKGRFEDERQDALDDPRLDDILNDVPLTASQQRDRLTLPADVPLTRRRGREFSPNIQRHVRGERGRGPGGEPQKLVGAMESEDEEEFARHEDVPGTSGVGGQAPTE